MTAQTTYSKESPLGLAGLVYDVGNTDIDSFAVETAAVPFGSFASRGTDKENQVVKGGAGAIGVAVRTAKENPYPDGGLYDGGEYAVGETAGILRSGYIWARFDAAGGAVGDAVTINADGYVVAAGDGTALTAVKAIIERPATDCTIETTTVFAGLVQVFPV